jgi:hypothetical protein
MMLELKAKAIAYDNRRKTRVGCGTVRARLLKG